MQHLSPLQTLDPFCFFTLPQFQLISWHAVVPLCPGPEPSLTTPPLRILASSLAWLPTLMASPPATRSLRRVSQPRSLGVLAPSISKFDSLVIWQCDVKAKGGFPTAVSYLCVSKVVWRSRHSPILHLFLLEQVSNVFWTSAMSTSFLVNIPPHHRFS